MDAIARANFVRESLPAGGLFADQSWRIAPDPFVLPAPIVREIESLGRVLLQFQRSVNLLYRRSSEGRMPVWIARLLDQGKPAEVIERQRHPAFRNELPRVIRPDLLLTEHGCVITELDSVPGGIGLTQWLNETYSAAPRTNGSGAGRIVGGAAGMRDGFSSIFGDASRVHVVVSEESSSYRPEMEWLSAHDPRLHVRDSQFKDFQRGDAVYRFFELFDLLQVPNASQIFELAAEGTISLTPPARPIFEEKLLFALLWNRNLHGFWRTELGEAFFQRLLKLVPRTWVLDPEPLPPHAGFPGLELTDWHQLKALSQRERDFILKISGFATEAWGSRGVFLGSDLSGADWSAAVDQALASWPRAPYVLQRYHKPSLIDSAYVDFERNAVVPMPARVRLCPYYFVKGVGDQARPSLGGVLATICPADKKIIHGMKDAILAPCAAL